MTQALPSPLYVSAARHCMAQACSLAFKLVKWTAGSTSEAHHYPTPTSTFNTMLGKESKTA